MDILKNWNVDSKSQRFKLPSPPPFCILLNFQVSNSNFKNSKFFFILHVRISISQYCKDLYLKLKMYKFSVEIYRTEWMEMLFCSSFEVKFGISFFNFSNLENAWKYAVRHYCVLFIEILYRFFLSLLLKGCLTFRHPCVMVIYFHASQVLARPVTIRLEMKLGGDSGRLMDRTGRKMRIEPLVTVREIDDYLWKKLFKNWYDFDRSQIDFVRRIKELGASCRIALPFSSDFDENGALYYIGTNGRTSTEWVNPGVTGLVAGKERYSFHWLLDKLIDGSVVLIGCSWVR